MLIEQASSHILRTFTQYKLKQILWLWFKYLLNVQGLDPTHYPHYIYIVV